MPTPYETDHHALMQYLMMKVLHKDWHAVSDAANDLRVMEAIGDVPKEQE